MIQFMAIALLLVNIKIWWEIPPASSPPVSSYRLCTGPTSGQHPTCVDIGPGTPEVIAGKQVLSAIRPLDLSSPVYLALKAVNSFGESSESSELTLGKPAAPILSGAAASM